MPLPSESMSMGSGSMPMGAEHMHVAIVSPAAMTKVTGNSVAVQVRATGFTDTCALAGKHLTGMEATATGHYHVLLDGALVNMYCTPTAVVSLQNVKPGMHTLTVVPALDDHQQVTHSARSIMFDYAPARPLPGLTGMMTMGKPSITILSPKPGATVSGTFIVTVRIKDFRASCALYGKPNLEGYGHWHLNLDSATGVVTVLTNASGFTLYWFAPDTATRSTCYGTCAGYWPPVTGTPSAGPGVTGKLGTIKRSDGTAQVTYDGHPLYTYVGDTAPGQAFGNNLNLNGGLWHEVTVPG